MLGTFILGIAAGWGAPYAEPKIKGWLGNVMPDEKPLSAVELRAASLALCVFAAAVASVLLAEGSAVPLTFGLLIGVAGPRLHARWKARNAPDYDS